MNLLEGEIIHSDIEVGLKDKKKVETRFYIEVLTPGGDKRKLAFDMIGYDQGAIERFGVGQYIVISL